MGFCGKCGEPVRGNSPCLNCQRKGISCHKCNEAITDPNEVIIKGGAEYHRQCLGLGPTSSLETKGGVWDSSVNDEKCPGCNKAISKKGTERDDGIVIKGGQSYHRDCLNLNAKEPAKWAGNKAAVCPGCNQPVTAGGLENMDMVIIAGQEWHRQCKGLDKPKEPGVWAGNAEKACPGCGKPAAGVDLVIVAGVEWHRACKGLTGESTSAESKISYEDHCEKCSKAVGVADKVINHGKVFHRDCFGGTGVVSSVN